jgi:lipopolysaccharide biosynthesis glycosyltransferase
MRLIATYNIGNLPYAEYTVPFMRRYAEKVGADFVEHRDFPGRPAFGSAAHWFSIQAIKAFAVQEVYEQLLLVDADVLILPRCRDLFEIAPDRIGVVQDMGVPMVAEGFRRWCREHYDELPVEGKYFNAGLLVIPRAAALRLLSHLTGPYPEGTFRDQNYLNLKLSKRELLAWLPQEFNWLAPQFKEASLKQQMVHFVGEWKKLLPWYSERLGR